jgi:hypothetical protein
MSSLNRPPNPRRRWAGRRFSGEVPTSFDS